jgi:hypothetical protein
MGIKKQLEGKWQPEEFCFHAEESAEHPGEPTCVDRRR